MARLAAFALLMAALVAGAAAQDDRVCCIDHPNKPTAPPAVANFDCDQLVAFGADRCNQVYGGTTCIWTFGEKCPPVEPEPTKCTRVENIVYFAGPSDDQGVRVDVGKCVGPCKDDGAAGDVKCKPTSWVEKEIQNADGTSRTIRIIKECDCAECAAVPARDVIEVPAGRCEGVCPDSPRPVTCQAGIEDNFAATGTEVPSPSAALITNYLGGCSAGIQTAFDQFVDNRCFGHTFSDCINPDAPCPIKSAVFSTCLRAANVALTQTDGMRISFNSVGAWGSSLNPYGATGTWRPGDEACFDLDLAALPTSGGGTINVIPLLQAAGSMDFAVQDDTAVDFVRLHVEYEDCLKCLPKEVTINSLYTAEGVTQTKDVRDCSCEGAGECRRLPLYTTYFPNTIFETTVDVGQCSGDCADGGVCVPYKRKFQLLRGPQGATSVPIIGNCICRRRIVAPFDDDGNNGIGQEKPREQPPKAPAAPKKKGGKK